VRRRLDRARLWRILLEGEVSTRPVVVTEVGSETTTKVSRVQDDHLVKKLTADGADHVLGEGVLPGRAWRSENLSQAHALHSSPELVTVAAIAVAQQVARRRVVGECLDDLLRSPGSSGGIGHVEVHDLSAMMNQHQERVEHAEGRRRHDEEVDGDEV
jgi:hypothetical protein